MYIVWGTKHRQERGGIVADWCNLCCSVQAHELTDHYQVNHLYYIPLGRGTLKASSRKCLHCHTDSLCEKHAYDQTLVPVEASGQRLADLVARTNSNLGRAIEEREQLERDLAGQQSGAVPAKDSDWRVLTALKDLKGLDPRRDDVSGFCGQLQHWRYLPLAERETLLEKVHRFASEELAGLRAVAFLRSLAPFQQKWLGGALTVAWLFALVVGYSMLPFLQSLLWGGIFFVAVTVGVLIWNARLEAQNTRRWVHSTLIPLGRDARIDFALVIGLLASIDRTDESVDERLRYLAGQADTIAGELLEKGLLPASWGLPTAEAPEATVAEKHPLSR